MVEVEISLDKRNEVIDELMVDLNNNQTKAISLILSNGKVLVIQSYYIVKFYDNILKGYDHDKKLVFAIGYESIVGYYISIRCQYGDV